jgi:hypothetical protein
MPLADKSLQKTAKKEPASASRARSTSHRSRESAKAGTYLAGQGRNPSPPLGERERPIAERREGEVGCGGRSGIPHLPLRPQGQVLTHILVRTIQQ